MNTKITEEHRAKPAYIYVRQSTLAQVRHHQESTERQYALREQALALGWPETTIRILDRDLGLSGAQMTGREDFKTLVADVRWGKWGQCLRWKSRAWHARTSTGIACWSCARSPTPWSSTPTAATTRAISTMGCCWVSKAPWRRPNCIFCAGASSAVSSTKPARANYAFPPPGRLML